MVKAFIYEENGKFYLADKYHLNIILFRTAEERQRWINEYRKEIGQLDVIASKPDVMDALAEGLDVDEATKKEVAERHGIPYGGGGS